METHIDEPPWQHAANLFTAWTNGDTAALDSLVRFLTPTLWQLARAYRLEPHTAEDVVQTTWLALVRSASDIRDPQSVYAWLTTATRREAWRQVGRAKKSSPLNEDLLEQTPTARKGPADEALDSDRNDRLWQATARLSERCQRLFRVIAFDDRPDYRNLAATLNMPIGSIGPTRARCLEKLRKELELGGTA